MMRLKSLSVVFIISSLWVSPSSGTPLPVLVGERALEGLYRFAIYFLGVKIYILAGIHTGYKRQTIKSEPEYEQIVEILDVPEDLALRQEQKKQQLLRKTPVTQSASVTPPSETQRMSGPYITNRNGYERMPGRSRSAESISTVASRLIQRLTGYRKVIPCERLNKNSKQYQRRCLRQPLHRDAISFMYKNYPDWNASPGTERGQQHG